MIARCDSLSQALSELEAGALAGATAIVMSRQWWDQLSPRERDGHRARAERAGVTLRADDAMSGHYVEVQGGDEGGPLSTEHPT